MSNSVFTHMYTVSRTVLYANYHHGHIIYKIHTNRNTCMTCHTKKVHGRYSTPCGAKTCKENSESTSQSKENRYRWVFGLDHNLGKGQM